MRKIQLSQFFFSLFSVVFFLYTFVIGINSFFRYNDFDNEYKKKSARLLKISKEHEKLTHMINDLNNKSTWESLAREKLNMIYPNETVYLFYHNK